MYNLHRSSTVASTGASATTLMPMTLLPYRRRPPNLRYQQPCRPFSNRVQRDTCLAPWLHGYALRHLLYIHIQHICVWYSSSHVLLSLQVLQPQISVPPVTGDGDSYIQSPAAAQRHCSYAAQGIPASAMCHLNNYTKCSNTPYSSSMYEVVLHPVGSSNIQAVRRRSRATTHRWYYLICTIGETWMLPLLRTPMSESSLTTECVAYSRLIKTLEPHQWSAMICI